MPKYEREPGRYSEKKPRPRDRGKTTKRFRNVPTLHDEDVERSARETLPEVRSRWEETRPEDLRTLTECDRCQRRLTKGRWQLRVWDEEDNHQELEPLFEPCEEHPGIFGDWVAERLEAMFRFLNEEVPYE